MRKQYEPNRWTRSWSGRGTAMINKIESSSVPKIVSAPSFEKRLSALLKALPYNKFYKSLLSQLRRGFTLSQKQLSAIADGYNKLTAA